MRFDKATILAHPACSGGSLIYRMLSSSFDMVGLSEKSDRFPYSNDAFLPTDPERDLLASGTISKEQYSDIFVDRIENAVLMCAQKNKHILIREHTHSYFFQADGETGEDYGPSWICNRIRVRHGQIPKCIISFRDPIDSWLGLISNFSNLAPDTFDNYCNMYLRFLLKSKAAENKNKALILRYEDVVIDHTAVMQRVEDYLGIPHSENPSVDWQDIAVSGNSGRRSDSISIRARRPFSLRLVSEAAKSKSYSKILSILNYSHVEDSVSFKTRIQSPFVQFQSSTAKATTSLKEIVKRWTSSHEIER